MANQFHEKIFQKTREIKWQINFMKIFQKTREIKWQINFTKKIFKH